MGVEAAFAVRVDVELNLANAAIELLRQRLMLVVQSFISVRILALPNLAFVGGDAGVIAVMGPYDLNLDRKSVV